LNCGLGVNDESTNLSTRGQLFKIKSVDISDFNTRDVSEGFDALSIFSGVHNQRSFLSLISFISEFSFTSSQSFGVNNFLDVFVTTEVFKEVNSLGSFGVVFKGANTPEKPLVVDNGLENYTKTSQAVNFLKNFGCYEDI
jgi:hypothetical protein